MRLGLFLDLVGQGSGLFEPTASLALDFTTGRYRVGTGGYSTPDFASLPNLTVTRATPSVAYGTTSAGVLVPFAANVARITNQGLLIEEARTNLVLQSQTLDNASWAQSNISVVPDVAVAPDATMTADRLVESSGTATHSWQQTIAKAASALVYTASGYFKYNGRGITFLVRDNASNANRAAIGVNLQTGAIAGVATALGTFTAASGTVTSFANGWFRVTLTFTTSTETSLSMRLYADNGTFGTDGTSYTGDGVSGFYGWGAQLEQAAFATSYIPTTSASVTRAADSVSFGGTIFAANSPTTIYGEWTAPQLPGGNAAVIGASAKPTLALGNTYVKATFPGVADVASAAVVPSIVGVNKGAAAFAPADFAVSAAGGAAVTGAGGTTWTASTAVQLGVESVYLNGYIRKAIVYPSRLSNAALQALTT